MKLRLLKVIIQPVFVLDDGDELTEVPVDAIALPPTMVAQIPTWMEEQRVRIEANMKPSESEQL